MYPSHALLSLKFSLCLSLDIRHVATSKSYLGIWNNNIEQKLFIWMAIEKPWAGKNPY